MFVFVSLEGGGKRKRRKRKKKEIGKEMMNLWGVYQ